MKNVALIMAGGRGERFWPRSRKSMPKQFLSLTEDGRTLIQSAVERIKPIVDIEDIYISTNSDYSTLVKEQLPDIPDKNIIAEPVGRNTAPCIGFSAAYISKQLSEDAVMLILPSDHLIKAESVFVSTLSDAVEVAADGDNLVTLGISPNYPETGYGYIKYDPAKQLKKACEVDHFTEKPDLEHAKEFVASKEYLWNSGMFIWRISTIMDRFKRFMPDTYDKLMKIKDAVGTSAEKETIETIYPTFPSISIDYGIMEKSDNIYTVPGDFGWDDVGSWLAVERIQKSDDSGNVISGNAITVGTKNCIIQSGDKLMALVGLKDVVVVDTEDATLICDKASTADIKKVLEVLRSSGTDKYL